MKNFKNPCSENFNNHFNNSFSYFVFFHLSNRIFALSAIIISVLLWGLFKYLYPNPNMIFDSYYYIMAAIRNENVAVWPIGYSRFLVFISKISRSPNFLVSFQYFLLQFVIIFFFFSIQFFFRLNRRRLILMFVFWFLNPIYIYTCNLVLSDSLFLSLSLLWITNLFWIIFRPAKWMLISQAFLLLANFAIRHTALYYPIIGCMAILLSGFNWRFKILGIGLQVFFVFAFIQFTVHENKRVYGVKQFSPFEGWKVASNALYIYEHAPANKLIVVPERYRELDSLVQSYYHSKHEAQNILNPDNSWGSFYMFNYPSPLIKYKNIKYGRDSKLVIQPMSFAKVGPLFDGYGKFLIKSYPFTFAKYFVLPNIWIYIFPYPEVYSDSINPFNLPKDQMGDLATTWFGIKTLSAAQENIEFRTKIFNFYPVFNSLIHYLFIPAYILFFLSRMYKSIDRSVVRIIVLFSILWVVNFTFIVIASASLLRYQIFITTMELTFSIIFWDFMMKRPKRCNQ